MTAYRRNFVPGGCFFFTVNLAERKLALLTDHVGLLRTAFRETHQRHPFTIDAIVVLPATFTRCGRYRKMMPILQCVGS